MAARLSPELRSSLRRGHRLRHIHIPDRPPFYAPHFLLTNIRDRLESQIAEQRAVAADWALHGDSNDDAPADLAEEMHSWLQRAGPPPTVLSCTRRPTYVLPRHYLTTRQRWEIDYLASTLRGKMQVTFPEPPGWSPLPWKPSWEQNVGSHSWGHDPLHHTWEPKVLLAPCANSMYFGPGQLSIWPVIDVLDHLQRGKKISNKFAFERLLEETTIKVLQRAYGIKAFAIAGSPGVWVESAIPPGELSPFDAVPGDRVDKRQDQHHDVRRIATIHADIVNNITRFGVTIHVGAPAPDADGWTATNNPWTALRQDRTTTSVAAELAHQDRDKTDEYDTKIRYLHTHFDRTRPSMQSSLQAMPYSLVLVEPGLRKPAPLGMDNRDLSTAWTYQFARELGMDDGLVDHFGIIGHEVGAETRMPTHLHHIGFTSRPVSIANALTEPYQELKVPEIQLLEAGPVTQGIIENTKSIQSKDLGFTGQDDHRIAVSWPMYYKQVINILDKSIRGSVNDTRILGLLWQKEKDAIRNPHQKILKQTLSLEDQWRTEESKTAVIKRPLTDSIAERLTENTLVMLQILSTLKFGGPWKSALLDSIAETRKILLSRFKPFKRRLRDANASAEEPKVLVDLIRIAQDTLDEATEMILDTPSILTEDERMSLLDRRSLQSLHAQTSTTSPSEPLDAEKTSPTPEVHRLLALTRKSTPTRATALRLASPITPWHEFTPTIDALRRRAVLRRQRLELTPTRAMRRKIFKTSKFMANDRALRRLNRSQREQDLGEAKLDLNESYGGLSPNCPPA